MFFFLTNWTRLRVLNLCVIRLCSCRQIPCVKLRLSWERTVFSVSRYEKDSLLWGHCVIRYNHRKNLQTLCSPPGGSLESWHCCSCTAFPPCHVFDGLLLSHVHTSIYGFLSPSVPLPHFFRVMCFLASGCDSCTSGISPNVSPLGFYRKGSMSSVHWFPVCST